MNDIPLNSVTKMVITSATDTSLDTYIFISSKNAMINSL